LEKQEAIVVRNPEATRPWQHVLEPLSGYLLLAERLGTAGRAYAGAWNFGPGKEANRSVRDLVNKLLEVWGGGQAKFGMPAGNAPHEARFLHLNCDKASQVLGWSERWAFEQGVERAVSWYRDSLGGADAWELTTGQIQDYLQAMPKRAVSGGS
jgi:CDP-glucose 4,6-dehydratase